MQLGAAPVNPGAGMTKGAQMSARFGSKFWGKPAGGNRNLWTNWREQRKGEPEASLQFIQLQHFFAANTAIFYVVCGLKLLNHLGTQDYMKGSNLP